MSEPEKIPDPEAHMETRDGVTVVGAQIIGEVKVDTTVRPRDPNRPICWPEGVPMPWKTQQPLPPESPLEAQMETRDGVTVVGAQIIGEVKVDTTVRPRDPNRPICWPEGVPMPWKTKDPPPPEPPKTE